MIARHEADIHGEGIRRRSRITSRTIHKGTPHELVAYELVAVRVPLAGLKYQSYQAAGCRKPVNSGDPRNSIIPSQASLSNSVPAITMCQQVRKTCVVEVLWLGIALPSHFQLTSRFQISTVATARRCWSDETVTEL